MGGVVIAADLGAGGIESSAESSFSTSKRSSISCTNPYGILWSSPISSYKIIKCVIQSYFTALPQGKLESGAAKLGAKCRNQITVVGEANYNYLQGRRLVIELNFV